MVKRKAGKLHIYSSEDLLSMSIYSRNGNCLLSEELSKKEKDISDLIGDLLVVLNFIGGGYFTSMV